MLNIFLSSILAAVSVITVSNQAEFDSMPQALRAKMSQGAENISVEFVKGTYFFKDQHVALNALDKPQTSICFRGNGATLIGAGEDLVPGAKIKGELDWRNGYVLPDGTDINPWSRMYDASGAIDIVDASKKLCRVRSSELHIPDRAKCPGAYILVTEWFKGFVYPVDHVKGDYIYFVADNLAKVSLGAYNVNNDVVYGGVGFKPRFMVFNLGVPGTISVNSGRVSLPEGTERVHVCSSNYAIVANNSKLKSLEISGFNFCGNRSTRDGSALIRLYGNDCGDIDIHDCSFNGIRSTVVTINENSAVSIHDNSFADLYSYGVYAYADARSVRVVNNIFTDCGLGMTNSFCIICSGYEYYIANNILRNFGSFGISVGAWHGGTFKKIPSGTVERNELYYDPEYAAEYRQHTLMDSGAIYIYTLNDRAEVLNNYIHDYCGMKDNRGIFCDDGARGFTLKGNVVLRVANSYCIDSRRVNASEDKNGRNNVGNVISDNIVDGPIRFEGNDAQRDCVMGNNWQLPASYTGLPDSRVRNINSPKKMTPVTGPKDRKLRRNPEYKKISKYLQ